MTESSITFSEGGTTFDGPDAVKLYHVMVLRSALKLLIKGIQPNRGVTLTGVLKLAGGYTGMTYNGGRPRAGAPPAASWAAMNLVVAIGASHARRVDRLNRRQVRRLGSSALRLACRRMRARGGRPLCAVDDLSVHAVGPWIDDFAIGLTRAALREGISIVGGEMAQMRDTYRPGYVGVVVYVTGVEEIA